MVKRPSDDVAFGGDGPGAGWPSNAPRELISLHGKISNGRIYLGRLLQDPSMSRAWDEIHKRVKEGSVSPPIAYQRLWGAIASALSQTNRNSKPIEKAKSPLRSKSRKSAATLPHTERKKKNFKIARIASQLADDLLDGPLDLYAYEFFPEDVLHLAGDGGAQQPQPGQKAERDIAFREALKWTTLHELLLELAQKARAEAVKPPVVAKMTREFRSNYFIRSLAPHFEHHFGGPMEGTLAAIANVVLERGESNLLNPLDVKRALRHEGGDKATK